VTVTAAISTEQVTRRFGERIAVDNLNLQVEQGEIFGFLGPNGAGKSTTIAMILGLLKPTSGRVLVLGKEIDERALELKTRIGVVGERQSLYGEMTAEQYLGFFADMYGVSNPKARIGDLLDALDLADRRRSRVKEYSHGMQQKLGLARALLHAPDLLVMDEPTSGLDPSGMSQVRHLIREHKRQGKTVFLSSHLLTEIEHTTDRVAIIAQGRLVAEGSVRDVGRRLQRNIEVLLEYEGDEHAVSAALLASPAVHDVASRDGKILVSVAAEGDARGAISRVVTAAGATVLSLVQQDISLEQAFLTITEGDVGRLAVDRSTSEATASRL